MPKILWKTVKLTFDALCFEQHTPLMGGGVHKKNIFSSEAHAYLVIYCTAFSGGLEVESPACE